MTKSIILLHGALSSKNQLQNLKNTLSKDFHVYDINFEGHGDRASHRNFTMEIFAENILQYIEENKLSKVSFFGYSMGGYAALVFAKKHPALVEKIFTLGTKFAWTEGFAKQEVRKLNPNKIEEKVPAFAQKLAAIHAPNDWKDVVTKTAKMMEGLGGDKKLSHGDFQEIAHPVLITRGSLDKMVTLVESQEIASLLPNATFQMLEGFPHLIEKVDAEKLAVVVKEFIEDKAVS